MFPSLAETKIQLNVEFLLELLMETNACGTKMRRKSIGWLNEWIPQNENKFFFIRSSSFQNIMENFTRRKLFSLFEEKNEL